MVVGRLNLSYPKKIFPFSNIPVQVNTLLFFFFFFVVCMYMHMHSSIFIQLR